uniref:Uncharacterized protein n=1 Tax=Avena sativa TaxID=4498 RepID=A0ACD5TR29_AVESA
MAVASGTSGTFSVRPTAPGVRARPCCCAAAARSSGSGNAKWWAPLLGWSGKPDYVDAEPAPPAPAAAAGARRFGVLTEEKARQLRVRMMETQSFHDAMYHSAIASRLASAAPDQSKYRA